MPEPRCLLTVAAPGVAVVGVLAEELRRRRLRVRVSHGGRSVYAKPRWPLVVNALAVVAAGEGFATPSLRAAVVADDAGGSAVQVWLRNVGAVSGSGRRLPDALNAMAVRFLAAGLPFSASPWERTPAAWNWRETLEDMV